MKEAAIIAIALALAGCVPPPPPAYQAAAPIPLDPRTRAECARIYHEIDIQQRSAAFDGVMTTALVEASMQLNAYNVITGLLTQAAIIGCG
jgi:hypothetical protein